jgi:hypothetical protein
LEMRSSQLNKQQVVEILTVASHKYGRGIRI